MIAATTTTAYNILAVNRTHNGYVNVTEYVLYMIIYTRILLPYLI
jgi:hypothetical protein